MDTRVRETLGQVWLPWFVAKDDPTRIISFEHHPPESARPFRVRDVAREDVQRTLDGERWADGTSIWSRIQSQMERLASYEVVLLILCAWDTGHGPMLVDGCHRTCAIYLLDLPRVEFELTYTGLEPGAPEVRAMRSL